MQVPSPKCSVAAARVMSGSSSNRTGTPAFESTTADCAGLYRPHKTGYATRVFWRDAMSAAGSNVPS